jgi:hypothetical protein
MSQEVAGLLRVVTGLLKNLWKSYENQNIIATFAVRKN